MQLEFQPISIRNAQVIDIHIDGINLKLIGCAPGLALRLLLDTRFNRALGRVLTPLFLGLRRLLLRCRNHLKYGVLSCGCYTYAYGINECSPKM
jgi:hypothetical protein